MFTGAKQIAALILAIVMLLLCACSGQKSGENAFGSTAAPIKGARAGEFENIHYNGDYKVMGSGCSLQDGCFANGRFYYSVKKVEDDSYEFGTLRSCLPDGSDDGEVKNFKFIGKENFPNDEIKMQYIYRIYSTNSCLYIMEYLETIKKQETGEDGEYNFYLPEQHYFLRQIDYDGNEISTVEYVGNQFDISHSSDLAFDNDGNIYRNDWSKGISVYSPNIVEIFTAENELGFYFIPSMNGEKPLVARTSRNGGYDILSINLETNKLEEKMQNVMADRFYYGAEGFDFTFSEGTTFYGADVETGEIVPLFLMANSGIYNETLEYVLPYEGGLVCVDNDGNAENRNWGITVLKRYDGGYSDDKTVLTLASCSEMVSNTIYRAVIKFNQMSTDYRVEIKDYSVYNEGVSGGATVLDTEIMAGKTPDMFITDGMNPDAYAERGILEDLLPYIDGDEELGGRDALVWPVFETMRNKKTDALYEITPGFTICAAIGDKRVIGDTDFSIEHFEKILSGMPDGTRILNRGFNRYRAVYWGMNTCFNDYVDLKNGTCSFDSPEFAELLSFWKDYFPNEDDVMQMNDDGIDNVRSGESLLAYSFVNEFRNISYLMNTLEDNEVFVGWPGSQNARFIFNTISGISMCSASEHKEAAWEFMRIMLLEETQFSNMEGLSCFKTNRRAFEMALENVTFAPEEVIGGEKPAMMMVYSRDGSRQTIYKLTEEQADNFRNLIEAPARQIGTDGEIFSIVLDEADAFFEDRRTAEETAAAIQRRVEIYLTEKK